jgi:hypothetical protein
VRQMQDNLNKASQRGDRLDALQDKTDNLATSAQGFRRGANRVRKQMWWKDMKMRICIIVGIIILLIVIIVPSGKDSRSPFCEIWTRKSLWMEMLGWIYVARGYKANGCLLTVIASKN